MRLIDADEVSPSDMLIAIADYVGDTKKKTVMCRRAVQGVQRLLDIQPTIDQWHYPSKGEYPPKGRQVLVYAWNVHFMLAKYDNMRTIDEGDKDMFVTYDANCVMREIKKVIAWMPLPDPPKEEA